MRYSLSRFGAAFAITMMPGPIIADSTSFDDLIGLYRPAGEFGADWSCNPDFLGSDGGALSIEQGYMNGVENRCSLSNQRPLGDGFLFSRTCSGEGSTYTDDVLISETIDGVEISGPSGTIAWTRCGASLRHTGGDEPSNGRWTFGGNQGVYESATRDANGNSITFICDAGAGRGHSGLRINLWGQPIATGRATIDVDGAAFEVFVEPDGGTLVMNCWTCRATFMELWEAAAAGNRMNVLASDGQSASFSLVGSRDALGYEPCDPG